MLEIHSGQHTNGRISDAVRIIMPDYFDSLSATETGEIFCLVNAILNNPDFVHPDYMDAETQHYSPNAKFAFHQFLSQELSKIVRY